MEMSNDINTSHAMISANRSNHGVVLDNDKYDNLES